MAACFADIKNCEEVCSLTGRSKHSGSAAFECGDFGSNIIICRILKSGIKITGCFKIKQFTHVFTGIIFEGC